jgi:hypothetical protein
MNNKIEKPSKVQDSSQKITVSKNGPYIVTGGIPLTTFEICRGLLPYLEGSEEISHSGKVCSLSVWSLK